MSIVLSGTPESHGEDDHELFPPRGVGFPSGVQRRWAVLVLAVSGHGRSSEDRADQVVTRTVRTLRDPRCAGGRHRRSPQTTLGLISEVLGDGMRCGWVVAVLAVVFVGLRRWACRRVVHSVVAPYLC